MEKISGFIKPDGSKIFNKNELKQQDQLLNQEQEVSENQQEDQSEVLSETSIETALSKVHSDGIAEVNKAATQLNGSLSDLKSAKKQINKEVKVLKELHSALKSGSQADIDRLQGQYQDLQKSRANLAETIDKNNLQRGYKPEVTLGNSRIGKVDFERVEFKDQTPEIDLNSASSVKAERERLISEERFAIKEQEREVKNNMQKLGVFAQEIEQRVTKSISNHYEASASFADKFGNSQELESFTKDLAQRIGSNADMSLNAHNITESSLRLLQ